MSNGLDIVLTDPSVRSVFVNVFGGITSCVEVANGVKLALRMLADAGKPVDKPIVCRIDGNRAEEGRAILVEAAIPGLELVETMDDAARRVAELAAAGK
jgi:succinyl-CoA synthetase beta subunit